MVATKLSEVMSKGIEWAYGGNNPAGTAPSQQQQPSIQTTWTSGDNLDLKALSLPPPSQQQQQQSQEEAQSSSWYSWSPWTGGISYWNYAADTLNQATEPIYSNFDDLMKYFHSDSSSSSKDLPMQTSLERLDENILSQQHQQQERKKYNSLGKYSDLTWMLKNPNVGVRGRGGNPSALPAVRSLLVAVDQLKTQQRPPPPSDDGYPDPLLATTTTAANASAADLLLTEESESMASLPPLGNDNLGDMYESWAASTFHGPNKKPVSSSETASLLAEGTLRSLRDFALDEAVELNAALQYWTIRWEMPFLSWLEAGPQDRLRGGAAAAASLDEDEDVEEDEDDDEEDDEEDDDDDDDTLSGYKLEGVDQLVNNNNNQNINNELEYAEETSVNRMLVAWKKTPPLTKAYLTASMGATTFGYLFNKNEFPKWLGLDSYRPMVTKLQLWRPLTAFLNFGPFGIGYVLTAHFVWTYMSTLERLHHNRPYDFWIMVLFGQLSMVIGYPILQLSPRFLGHNLSTFLVYVWSRSHEGIEVKMFEMFTIRAELLPWFFLGQTFLLEGEPPILDLLGIVFGHVYYHLNKNGLLRTPQFLIDWYQGGSRLSRTLQKKYKEIAADFEVQ